MYTNNIEFNEVAHHYKTIPFNVDGKPILRLLNDITEEEIIQILRIMKAKNINMEDIPIIREKIKESGLAAFQLSETSNFSDVCFMVTWLIQNHFDLFNLIETGQAIDKSTL